METNSGCSGGSVGDLNESNQFNNTITSTNNNALITNSSTTSTNTTSTTSNNMEQYQLDGLSNLLINSWEDDAALDQYESEMDRTLNENLLSEKEQSSQRLFQSFQTSACAVAQMFKDKTTLQSSNNAAQQISSWQSFQNSAGAITVLYKESLEACKVNMELGVCIGQQRKLKEIINWLKKKKKRNIRKDELISFLIGKQYPNQNQMFNLFNPNNSNSSGLTNYFMSSSGPIAQQQSHSMFVAANNRRQQQQQQQQQQQRQQQQANRGASASSSIISTPSTNTTNLTNNSDCSNDSHPTVDTSSDLATFREALIMHNRSRDAPLNRNQHQYSNNHTHAHPPHHHHNHIQHHHYYNSNHSQNQQINTSTNPLQQQQQQQTLLTNPNLNQQNCDDLDCFFCEQIATHIEHKRSSANLNFDMESPTRKRGRFY